MSLSWNLLNYPALHLKRRRRHRIITSLAGWTVGAMMVGASLFWTEKSLQGLRLQQAQLQAQWREARQQLQLEQQQAAARESNRHQTHFLRQVSQQNQAWMALNHALLSEAQEASWRLVRLQLVPGKMELSGWGRDFEALNASRHRLTHQLMAAWPDSLVPATAADVAPHEGQQMTPSSAQAPAPSPSPNEWVRQTSVSVRGGADLDRLKATAGLEFVWVSPWPTFKPMAAMAQSRAQGVTP